MPIKTKRPQPVKASKRSKTTRMMLIVLLASNIMASIGQSMMNIAIDAVSEQFAVELAVANWMVLGFSIVAGTIITTAASVLRRFGLRKVMMFGYALELAGSLLGFFSWDFPSMLAARFLQAATAGLFFPIISVAILDIAPKGKKATLLSLNSAVIGAGLAFSPVISGIIITYINLHSVFLFTAVYAAVLLIIGPFTLYDVETRENTKIDKISIVLSFAGLFTFFYGLNSVAKDPLPSLGIMTIGLVIIAIFAWRQFHCKNPLLNLEPLRDIGFTIGETIALLGFMGSLYMSLLVPLYLEGVAGYTPFIAGCMLVAPILLYSLSTFVGGKIEDVRGIWPLVPIGFLVLLLGLIGLEFFSSETMVVFVIVCCGVVYFGVGFIFAPLKSRDLEAVPEDLLSNASAIHSTMAQVVTAVASALFVGIMSSDVTSAMHAGATKASAYALGFSHTLIIEIGIALAMFIASIFFARYMHKRFVEPKKES